MCELVLKTSGMPPAIGKKYNNTGLGTEEPIQHGHFPHQKEVHTLSVCSRPTYCCKCIVLAIADTERYFHRRFEVIDELIFYHLLQYTACDCVWDRYSD